MASAISSTPAENEAVAAGISTARAGTTMLRTRVLISAMCCASALLAGCATDNETGPFFLGAVDAAEINDAAPADEIAPAVKRVRSNKLLAAMALQKVTGRTIDAARLSEKD